MGKKHGKTSTSLDVMLKQEFPWRLSWKCNVLKDLFENCPGLRGLYSLDINTTTHNYPCMEWAVRIIDQRADQGTRAVTYSWVKTVLDRGFELQISKTDGGIYLDEYMLINYWHSIWPYFSDGKSLATFKIKVLWNSLFPCESHIECRKGTYTIQAVNIYMQFHGFFIFLIMIEDLIKWSPQKN